MLTWAHKFKPEGFFKSHVSNDHLSVAVINNLNLVSIRLNLVLTKAFPCLFGCNSQRNCYNHFYLFHHFEYHYISMLKHLGVHFFAGKITLDGVIKQLPFAVAVKLKSGKDFAFQFVENGSAPPPPSIPPVPTSPSKPSEAPTTSNSVQFQCLMALIIAALNASCFFWPVTFLKEYNEVYYNQTMPSKRPFLKKIITVVYTYSYVCQEKPFFIRL